MSNVNENATLMPILQTAVWAEYDFNKNLIISGEERSIKIHNSDGTGTPLLDFRGFGADIVRFAGGKGVMNHTHEGDHILFVLKGKGIVEYNGLENPLYPGLCYLIPGMVDHAIKAEEDLVLISVCNNYKPLDGIKRMKSVNE